MTYTWRVRLKAFGLAILLMPVLLTVLYGNVLFFLFLWLGCVGLLSERRNKNEMPKVWNGN